MPGQSLALPGSAAEIPLLFMETRRGQCDCRAFVYSGWNTLLLLLIHCLLLWFSPALFPGICSVCSRFWYEAMSRGTPRQAGRTNCSQNPPNPSAAANLWFHSCHLSISNTTFPHPSNCTGMTLREPWHPCRAEAKISHCLELHGNINNFDLDKRVKKYNKFRKGGSAIPG